MVHLRVIDRKEEKGESLVIAKNIQDRIDGRSRSREKRIDGDPYTTVGIPAAPVLASSTTINSTAVIGSRNHPFRTRDTLKKSLRDAWMRYYRTWRIQMSEREKLLKKNLCLLQDFCWRNIISISFIYVWNFYFGSGDFGFSDRCWNLFLEFLFHFS